MDKAVKSEDSPKIVTTATSNCPVGGSDAGAYQRSSTRLAITVEHSPHPRHRGDRDRRLVWLPWLPWSRAARTKHHKVGLVATAGIGSSGSATAQDLNFKVCRSFTTRSKSKPRCVGSACASCWSRHSTNRSNATRRSCRAKHDPLPNNAGCEARLAIRGSLRRVRLRRRRFRENDRAPCRGATFTGAVSCISALAARPISRPGCCIARQEVFVDSRTPSRLRQD